MDKRKFNIPNSKEEILNKCPLCGNELEYIVLYQYSNVYRILKNGEISKTRKYKRDEGSMECGFIACSNDGCDFHTDCDLDIEAPKKYNHIRIYQNNNGQFMIDVDEWESCR